MGAGKPECAQQYECVLEDIVTESADKLRNEEGQKSP
jgi:hypothetical protein